MSLPMHAAITALNTPGKKPGIRARTTVKANKDGFTFLVHLESIAVAVAISLLLACSGYAAERNITLQWDESIDAHALQSYKIYYYTTPGNPGSLDAAYYAASYSLEGGSPIFINPLTDPKPVTIDKSHTQITLHFPDDSKDYCFVLTAVDAQGIESMPTPEISTASAAAGQVISGPDRDGGECFIATAAFGSYLDPHVQVLRNFRDRHLLTYPIGQAFVSAYYRYSPPIAAVIRKHEALRSAARWALVPVVYSVDHPFFIAALFSIPVAVGLAYRRRRCSGSGLLPPRA